MRAERNVQRAALCVIVSGVGTPQFPSHHEEEHCMTEAVIAASAAICVAVLGALLLYVYARRLQRQAGTPGAAQCTTPGVYGPFYAMFQAQRIAHLRFMNVLRPGSATLFAPVIAPLNDVELRLWRLWAESAQSTQVSSCVSRHY